MENLYIVNKEGEVLTTTKEINEKLIEAFDKNNINGKVLKPTGITTGKFRAISIEGKPVIGTADKFDESFAHIFINTGLSKELTPCYVRTLSYQTVIKDSRGINICEGDVILYKNQYRIIELKRNGTFVYATFRRIFHTDGANMNAMPLEDISHKSHIIKIICNIFDNIDNTAVYDLASNETIQGINQKLGSLSPDELNEIIHHIDLIGERNERIKNGLDQPMPLQTGEKTIVEVEITDEFKAFDFFGRSITGRSDMSEYGFEVTQLYFSKDKFTDTIESQLKNELLEAAGKAATDFYTTVNRLIGEKDEYIPSLNK